MDWSVEAIERLRALWAEGHSTAEIARRMGLSKNAVVGKAHRLNLPARPSPIRRGAEPPGTKREAGVSRARTVSVSRVPGRAQGVVRLSTMAPSPALTELGAPGMGGGVSAHYGAAVPESLSLPSGADVGDVDALSAVLRPPRREAQQCCWPIGEPGEPGFHYCSGEAITRRPYCPEHTAVACRKAPERRQDMA